jgi:hypothetical protein
MWVSRKEFEELRQKVESLQDATWSVRAPYGAKLGRVVDMLIDYMGVSIERRLEHDRVVKKGGPERCEEPQK